MVERIERKCHHVTLQSYQVSFKQLVPMDIDSVKSDSVKREFLAIVLAGFGNE